MQEPIEIHSPFSADSLASLRAGDRVRVSGIIYTARDKAHKRLLDALDRGEELPVSLENQAIYFAGPTPAKPGQVIGSVGPTTSSRMDAFSPRLLREASLRLMIGKGPRSSEVVEALVETGSVYLVAVGGAGVAISKSVISAEVLAYDDLGTEAVRRLEVKDFAAIVAIDSRGNNIFEFGRAQYAQLNEGEDRI